jgi:rSAM/selenodomain-associated transferase 2
MDAARVAPSAWPYPAPGPCYRRTVKIAVVIPALDEVQHITGAIASAKAPGVEVVVVDGGSRDGTAERARAVGARVMGGAPGRARQLQRGVEASSSEVVLLLHADSRLPSGWAEAVERLLRNSGVVGGAFRLCFDEPGAAMRLLEWGVRLRVALFGLPYGDQAIFVRRSVLEDIGGVPDVPFMEDLDLVKAVRARGRLVVLPLPVETSARRYRQAGVLRTVVLHLIATAAWGAGVDRLRILRWVRG